MHLICHEVRLQTILLRWRPERLQICNNDSASISLQLVCVRAPEELLFASWVLSRHAPPWVYCPNNAAVVDALHDEWRDLLHFSSYIISIQLTVSLVWAPNYCPKQASLTSIIVPVLSFVFHACELCRAIVIFINDPTVLLYNLCVNCTHQTQMQIKEKRVADLPFLPSTYPPLYRFMNRPSVAANNSAKDLIFR